MDLMVSSDATVGISVGPFERRGTLFVDFDIARDAFLQKAVSPKFNGIDATRLAATDRRESLPAGQS